MNGMRLRELVIRDFRSISGEWRVPLDADIVLIQGLNGTGKTSLLSGLELAATGRIAHLEASGDSSYHGFLHHRGRASGRVQLSVDHGGLPSLGHATVSPEGLVVEPLLSDEMAETFVERCFLPQATMGRLLELYAPREDVDSSPLVAFVKNILGLDRLDNLIDGLEASGHVTRAQKLSANWQVALRARGEEERRELEVRRALEAEKDARDRAYAALRDDLGFEIGRDDVDVESLIGELDVAEIAGERERLATILARVEKIDAIVASLFSDDDGESEREERGVAERDAAAREYSDWCLTSGAMIASALAARTVGSPAVEAPQIRGLLDEAITHQRRSIERLNSEVNEVAEIGILIARTNSEIEELRARQSAIARDIADVYQGSDVAELAGLIAGIAPFVDAERCPVCDQEFGGNGRLVDHVRAKGIALAAAAETIGAASREAKAAGAQIDGLLVRLSSLEREVESRRPRPELDEDLVSRERELDELRRFVADAERGVLLHERVVRAQFEVDRSAADRSLRERAESDLADVSESLGAAVPAGSLQQRVAHLRSLAAEALSSFSADAGRRSEVRRRLVELKSANERLARRADELVRQSSVLAELDLQLAEAKRRKEIASDLRKSAERMRSEVVNRVFDERLNSLWSSIFRALVPTEMFVPRFRKLTSASRAISVELETADWSGIPAASPAAMLSQGNLNTAALSLFAALHFASPSKLPWLLFDDPVQSMDDLHVANFAAIVKQIARRFGRQVVISVHQRELFDYLALELTPAARGQSLMTVNLEKVSGQTRITHQPMAYVDDASLVSVA